LHQEHPLNSEWNFVQCELSHRLAERRRTLSSKQEGPQEIVSECMLRVTL